MSEKENVEKQAQPEKTEKRNFNFLVALASILSVGSLTWTTYSLIDFFEAGRIGISAAATADVAWTATIYAEYRGVRAIVRKKYNLVPILGWIEVGFVMVLLALHGHQMGNGSAAFAAALPLLAKVTWMLALADLKDPAEMTEEQKAKLADKKRETLFTEAELEVTRKQHEADMASRRRKHEAELEDMRAAAEKKRLDQETENELKMAQIEAQQNLKLAERTANAHLLIALQRVNRELETERYSAEQEMRLLRPLIVGETISRTTPQLLPSYELSGVASELSLKDAEVKQMNMARDYYAVADKEGGNVTKAAFAKVNNINPPRVTEATTRFPREWFIENGLADWLATE